MALDEQIGEVNEDSTAYLTFAFFDKAGVAAVPATVSYRVDCVTNSQAVRATTALVAASSIEVTLEPADNAIIDATNEYEVREVTVSATFGAGQESHEAKRYRVRNLAYKT